jgi:isoquinoline 1-oxidoreductase beta subunit
MSSKPTSPSRRDALRWMSAAGAGLVVGFHMPYVGRGARAVHAADLAGDVFEANAFVRIGTDDIVTVMVKHLEFGQGPATGLSTLVADELDADWSQIRAELAPANVVYKNLLFGMQGTGGSTAMANSFTQMRAAGATARAMLVGAAAKKWKKPKREITVSKGVVRHAKSGKQATFGELAMDAAKQPVPKNPTLKKPEQWTLIGTDVPKLDSFAKSRGMAKFTLDHYPDGVVTAVVAHPPAFGATAISVDDAKALAVPGVLQVAQIPNGVAVIASDTFAALRGRDALEIEWDESAAERRSSEAMFDDYRAAVSKPGVEAATRGDLKTGFADGNKTLEAEYLFPFLAHAPMEPLDAVVQLGDDSAEVWMGSQIQTIDQGAMAQVLGLKPDKIALHTVYAGGSFGRRAQADISFAVEAALVAKSYGKKQPVKLMWTRVDDIRGGYYRPLTVHKLRGAVDASGAIVGWEQVVASSSIAVGTMFEPFMVQNGLDNTMVEGAHNLPYAIPNFRVGAHIMDNGVPVLWWRSVGHTHTGYTTETFVDELLELGGKDPVAGRLALLDGHPRHTGVLERVAEMAGWSGTKAGDGRTRGVAVHESFGSFVAQIAEVSEGPGGVPRVHKVWCAVDCGVAVNPNIVRAQMEGGIGFGLGATLYSEINIEDGGHVREANFDTYRSLRIHEMPVMFARLRLVMTLGVAALLASCGAKQSANGDGTGESPDAEAAFAAMGQVLTSARCMNCHPSGDSPTQGDTMTEHQPPVFRGEGGLGAVGMRCSTCHGESNVPLVERDGSMPGAMSWHLAPVSMGWQGQSLGAICEQLKDPARNGGKSLEQVYEHMANDPLVGWAWEPGEGRTKAPGTQAEFANHTRAWIDGGAPCPAP